MRLASIELPDEDIESVEISSVSVLACLFILVGVLIVVDVLFLEGQVYLSSR